MTEKQIYSQAATYKKMPESPGKWQAYSTFRRQLETIVPTARIDEATRKLCAVMRL